MPYQPEIVVTPTQQYPPVTFESQAYSQAIWNQITGTPYITVSAKGVANGLSDIANDGANFGPDTKLGATSPSQYGPPYTQTTGIQEAVNYVGSLGSGKIVFREGTFYLNNYISSSYSNMVFTGQGIHKTIIMNNPDTSYFPGLIGQTNILMENMDLIANASTHPSTYIGLYLGATGCEHITYKSCYFAAPGCQVGFTTSGALTGTTPYNGGASTDMPYDISFLDCIFDGENPYATSPNFGSVMGVDIKFINCLFTSSEPSTTISNPIIPYGLSRPNYDGPHYFIGCTFDTSQVHLRIEQGYSPTVLGCTFLNGAWIDSYANIDYSSYEAPDIGIKIIGNEFSGDASTTSNFIGFSNSEGEQSVVITGNHFINTSTSVTQASPQCDPVGISTYYTGPITGIEITNNIFDNMGQAIWLNHSSTSVGQIGHNTFNQSLSTTDTTASAIYYYSGGTGNFIIEDNYNNGYSSFFSGGGTNITLRHILENNFGTGLPYVPSTPAVPASGTAQQNTNQYTVNVYIYGGTVTEIQITRNGTAYTVFSNSTGLALSGQTYKLNPGDSITITYTTAPTWEWMSD